MGARQLLIHPCCFAVSQNALGSLYQAVIYRQMKPNPSWPLLTNPSITPEIKENIALHPARTSDNSI